jgi:hypothetical protein
VKIALPRNKVLSSTHRNLDPNVQSHVDLHKSSNDNPKANVQKLKGSRNYQRAMLTHDNWLQKDKGKFYGECIILHVAKWTSFNPCFPNTHTNFFSFC